jgi:penicillin-binding protein 1A
MQPFHQQSPPRPSLGTRIRRVARRTWALLGRVSLAGEAATLRQLRAGEAALRRYLPRVAAACAGAAAWTKTHARRGRDRARQRWRARRRPAGRPGARPLARRLGPVHVGSAVVAVLLLDLWAWQTCGFQGCPDVRLLASYTAQGTAVLVDRDGEEVARLRPVQREVVGLDSVPYHLMEAFVAVEDQRFYDHSGIDWVRVGGAFLANVRQREVAEGGSTISMQLARNLFADRLPARERTLQRKLLEVRVAREIERRFEKHEILELYLNHIYLGGGAYGVEAAAHKYFGKPAAELTLAESALLAALPKAPTHYDPRARVERAQERRDLVIGRMERQGRITAEEAESARNTRVAVQARARREEGPYLAPWFVEMVRAELEEHFGEELYRRPLRVFTTMDAEAQRKAEAELRSQLASVERGLAGRFQGPSYAAARASDSIGTGYLQGALVLLNPRTGDVLAYVGGRDFEDSPYDRASGGLRQLGSTFKPFVYAAAIAAGIPPSTVLDDVPVRLVVDGTPWEPRNYDDSYRGRVRMRDALVHSLNVPTVLLTNAVGINPVRNAAHDAGLRRPMPASPVVALGAIETNPIQLALAFTAFASLGERVTQPRFVLRVEDDHGRVVWQAPSAPREPVFDPGVAYIVTDMLRDAVRRGTGTGALAGGYRGPLAGKTGTTNDAADAWFVGYTPDVVGVVWVGFDRRRAIASRATGGRIAAPIWGRVVPALYQDREQPADWKRPDGVVARRVDPETGVVLAEGCVPYWSDPVTEYFLARALPAPGCPVREIDRWWGRQAWDRLWGRQPEQRVSSDRRGPRVLGVPAGPPGRARGRGRN